MVERSTAEVLAKLIQEQRDQLAREVLKQVLPPFLEPATLLFHEWLDSIIAQLRGGVGHSYEWASRMMASAQAAGVEPEVLFVEVAKQRKVFVDFMRPHCAVESVSEIYEIFLGIESEYMQHLTTLCAQFSREALAAERRRQVAMAEAVGHAFVMVDSDGRITLANSQCTPFLGISPDALQDAALTDLCDLVAAAELRRVLRQKRGAGVRSFTGNMRSARGTLLPCRITAYPIFDAQGLRCGLAISICDLDQPGELSLPQRLELFDRIAEVLGIGFQLLDQEGQIVYTNGVARDLMTGAVESKPYCCTLLPADNPDEDPPIWAQVLKSGRTRQEAVPRLVSGENRWIELAVVPDRAPTNAVTRIICLMRDVTQQRALERSLIEQQRTSLAAQLAVAVAHQLRNPLSVMIGFAEMLSMGMPHDRVQDALDRLLRNGLRCKKIVEDLLEFGQGLPGERVATELNALLRDLVQPAEAAAQRAVEWHLADAPCTVLCIPQQLGDMFKGLLDNAFQAGAQLVSVTVDPGESLVRIRISDDGPGIPEDLREKVFQPFFSTRRDKGAVGLGLSLAQYLVQDSGGRLYLDPASDSGATFVVELPLTQRAPRPRQVQTMPEPQEAPRRLIIVDDEADLLELLKAALAVRGYEADTATTGGEALPLIAKNDYEMAVLDVQLPGELSGQQLYQYLRGACPKLANRILFITADTLNYETRRFLADAKQPVLEKPFLVSSFVERVREMIEPKQQRPVRGH